MTSIEPIIKKLKNGESQSFILHSNKRKIIFVTSTLT